MDSVATHDAFHVQAAVGPMLPCTCWHAAMHMLPGPMQMNGPKNTDGVLEPCGGGLTWVLKRSMQAACKQQLAHAVGCMHCGKAALHLTTCKDNM